MAELEKRGVPTVSWVGRGFVDDAKMSARVFGSKGVVLAVLSRETAVENAARIHEMVAESINQVINGLVRPVRADGDETKLHGEVLTIQGIDLLDATEKMNREFISEGWSDGFPLVPPTSQAVERMLTGTRLGRDQEIAFLEPGQGVATVEKIAINAVMAGCRPEHLPLLITAVRCISQPELRLHARVMSTQAQSPFMLVNGPVVQKLNINSKCSTLDPGSPSYANIAIGRALSLFILNIGHGYPGVMSMSTIGSPRNYSLCVAENEEDSPWEPYHVEKGFYKNASTVTIQFVDSECCFGDLSEIGNTAEGIANGYSWIARRTNGCLTALWLLEKSGDEKLSTIMNRNIFLICPAQARALAREGWDKKRLRQYLFDHAKLPLEALMFGKQPRSVIKEHPELAACLEEHSEVLLPVVTKPEDFQIVVVGGSGPCSSYFEATGGIATLPIGE